MVHDGERIGYFVAGFFALGLVVFALQFHPKAAYLHLAPEGFTFCGLFRAHTVRWIEVDEFGVTRVGPNSMVAWDYRPNYEPHARGRALSISVCGYEAALPDTYGMKPHELATLMENLRQKYTKPSN